MAGSLALALTFGTTVAALSGLLLRRDESMGLDAGLLADPYIHHVLGFTVWQALLSTLLSLLLAIPLARALHYHATPRVRRLLLTLSLLAFAMPTLVLITGLILLLGRHGLLTGLLASVTDAGWTLYGLPGILLAHVYLNLPLAVRILSHSLATIPGPAERLASQWRLTTWQRVSRLEWPHCRAALLAATGLIFILCFNSFSIVLALGGGPSATTLEVAIYQALKFDFDLDEVLLLSGLQLLIVGVGLVFLNRGAQTHWLARPSSAAPQHPRRRPLGAWTADAALAGYGVFLMAPALALIHRVLQAPQAPPQWSPLWLALLHSLLIATLVAVGSVVLGWLLLLPGRLTRQRHHGVATATLEWLSLHTLPLPAMVLSVGLYMLLLPEGWLPACSLPVLVWLNALLTTPFVVTQLKPLLYTYDDQYQTLLSNWRISFLAALRLEWQALRGILPSLASLTGLLALGDVSVFAILGEPGWTTLPWLIYQYAGSYRLHEAALASLLLLAISVILVLFIEGKPFAGT